MFFVLSKILRLLLDPVFVGFCLVLIVYVLVGRRADFLKRTFFLLFIAVFYGSTTFFFSGFILHKLEYAVPSVSPVPKSYDLILTAAGYINNTGPTDDIPSFNDSSERFFQSIKFLREGVAPVLLLTGGSGNLDRSYPGESQMAAVFAQQYLAVRPDQIIVENESRNSFENAVFSAKIINALPNAERILLITSADHMLRMSLAAKKAGITFDTFSVDFTTNIRFVASYAPFPYVPSYEGLNALRVVLRETVGLIMYSFAGYI